MKIVVLDAKQLSDLDWTQLEGLGKVTKYDFTPPELVEERARGAQAVLLNKVKMTVHLMDKLPDMKYIGVLATGYDNVDLAAARERGIVVTNVPKYSTDSVAQLVFALLLELCHHVGDHSADVIENKAWSRQIYYSYWNSPLMELAGKTIGIVGMGAIGQKTAQIARAFGMKVLACSRTKKAVEGVEWVEFDELLSQSDVISMNCPLTDATRGIMNRAAFEKMKKTAFFINTGRGGVVVDGDLRAALDEGLIAGAAVDVMTQEPPSEENVLLGAKNIIITPHIAWATGEARERLLKTAIENVAAWQAGAVQNRVN